MTNITNFTIFGERNSGTNYLKRVLSRNLMIPFTQEYGHKHWFIKGHQPRGRSNLTTDNECIKSLDDSDETLFIFIVRNTYDWLKSTYKKPYHIKTKYKNFIQFIEHPYISYELNCPKNHGPTTKTHWLKDKKTNTYFIDESKNIITLRNKKNNHFYSLRNRVRHFALIRQEHLKEDIEKMIDKLKLSLKSEKFQLSGYRKPKSYIPVKLNRVQRKREQRIRNIIKKYTNNNVDSIFYSK